MMDPFKSPGVRRRQLSGILDSKVHGANMGPTWVLSAPDGPHVGPMILAIRDIAVPSNITVKAAGNIYSNTC